VHRIGRTGRAGNGGIAISFCSKDEHAYWKDIQKLIKVDVKTVSDHPYPWHSGSPETAPASAQNNSNRSGEANKSRKSSNSKQNKKRWY
jgi:ATP-dependent RNA helicase RhlE